MATETDVKLIGYTELMLVDRETHKIDTCVKQKNQLTEPFARWLLSGNMCSPDGAPMTITTNPISNMLGSASSPRLQTTTVSSGSDSSTGAYGIYLMSENVNISKGTQIPPYVGPSLGTKAASVVYYGTEATADDGSTMAPENAACKWSRVGDNPAFTVTYTKDDNNTHTIKSIVLGVAHNMFTSNGYTASISIRQSTPVIPPDWDMAWSGSTADSLVAPSMNSQYLIAPFLRTKKVDGRWGDGIYTLSTTSGSNNGIGFFDLANKSMVRSRASTEATYNNITTEYYVSQPTYFVSSTHCGGGFAIGNGKAIRITRGASVFSGNTIVSRRVRIETQRKLSLIEENNQGWSDTLEYEVTSATGAAINSSIAYQSAPVMVAIRGTTQRPLRTYTNADNETVTEYETIDDPAQDRIEIYLSMETGTFTAQTAAQSSDGYAHPGGTGIAVYKLVIMIQAWRAAATDISLTNAPITNYGRVAVIPYAIGIYPSNSSSNADESMNGANYTCGAYDPVNDTYYLPITHICEGVTLHNWNLANTAKLSPVSCANSHIQPGLMFDAGLTRIGDFFFAMGPEQGDTSTTTSVRTMMLTNDEGYVPITVNSTQLWSKTQSLVMSGLTLTTPIVKASTQILVVRYTYAFEIAPSIPASPVNFIVRQPSSAVATSLVVSWTPQERVERIRLRRSLYSTHADETKCYVPSPIINPDNGVFTDTLLHPRTTYYYRMRNENSSSTSSSSSVGWALGSATTKAFIETVASISSITSVHNYRDIQLDWEWNQPTPSTDISYNNDITTYFDTYKIQYRKHPTLTDKLSYTYDADDFTDAETWTTITTTTPMSLKNYDLISLDPKSLYLIRIRAEIESNCYENSSDAVSAWENYYDATADLPVPVAFTNITTEYIDYDYTTGIIKLTWDAQPEVACSLVVGDTTYTTEANTKVLDALVVNGSNGLYDAFSATLQPYNSTHTVDTSLRTTTTTSTKIMRYNDTTTTPVINTVEGRTGAGGEWTTFSTSGFGAELARVFAQGIPADITTSNPAVLTIAGSASADGVYLADQKYLRFRLGYSKDVGTTIKAWKFPFMLRRLFGTTSTDGEAIAFPSGTRLGMTVYGGVTNESEIIWTPLGTLNSVPGIDGSVSTFPINSVSSDASFNTMQRALAHIQNSVTYSYFMVEWVLSNPDGAMNTADELGRIVTKNDYDKIQLELHMFTVLLNN